MSTATLSEKHARMARTLILTLSIGSLVAVFQPFSNVLFQLGMVLAVVSAIIFNLMPALTGGNSLVAVRKTFFIILIVLFVLIGIAVASAWGYVLYLQAK